MVEILFLINLAAAGAALFFGYSFTKRFVRDRLRFVDGVHRGGAPLLAGLAAGAVGAVAAAVLPIVGGGAAVALGLGVGFGVSSGRRDIKRLNRGR